jgi:hypothetical protein
MLLSRTALAVFADAFVGGATTDDFRAGAAVPVLRELRWPRALIRGSALRVTGRLAEARVGSLGPATPSTGFGARADGAEARRVVVRACEVVTGANRLAESVDSVVERVDDP